MAIEEFDLSSLPFVPEKSSYSYGKRDGLIIANVPGGLSKVRTDVLNPTSFVTCLWELTPAQYRYFMLFRKLITENGALPFTAQLLLDNPELEEFTCRFVPDSMTVDSPSTLLYTISAELEVEPLVEADSAFTDFLVEYASDEFDAVMNELSDLVNIYLGGV